MEEKERITYAAVKFSNGTVLTGRNHGSIISNNALDPEGIREYVKKDMQGFLTSTGRFVDRQEAALIAWEAGQTQMK